MENIKLSDFKGISKFTLIDKVFSKVEEKLKDKQLEVYDVNEEIQKKLSELEVGENDIKFLYDLTDILTNVDKDVTILEFEDMCKYPSQEFISYIKVLTKSYQDIFMKAKEIKRMEDEFEGFSQEIGVNFDELKELRERKVECSDE